MAEHGLGEYDRLWKRLGHFPDTIFIFHSSSTDVLAEETEEKMVEFAMGGLCNCCLDKLNKSYIVENGGVELTVKCLSRSVSVQVSLSNTVSLCTSKRFVLQLL